MQCYFRIFAAAFEKVYCVPYMEVKVNGCYIILLWCLSLTLLWCITVTADFSMATLFMVPSSCKTMARVRVDNGEIMHSADNIDFMTLT